MWFKRKNKKAKVEDKKEKMPELEKIELEESKYQDKFIKSDIISKKKDAYEIPGVDVANYDRNIVKNQRLTRPTSYWCPVCKSQLYNTVLDGEHFYCPTCEKQFKL